MSLLGDTPFLNQLRESTGILTENVANTDTTQIKSLFGNYNPNAASDYVFGPMGGIAQNQFDANQFQLPYQPGEFTTFGGQFGSGGFNLPYNPSTYNPGQFNQYGNIPVTGNIPSNVSTTTTSDRGGNGPNQDPFSGRYESFGDQTFSIDENGNPTLVDGTPLTSPLLGLLSGIGKLIPGEEARRFENLDEATQNELFGLLDEETKKALVDAVDTNVTRDYTNQGLISQLTPAEQARLGLTDVERDIVSKKSGYGLFGIGKPSEKELADRLQEQQNQRDLQKQAEKERQKNLSAFNERQKKQQQKEKDREGGGGGGSSGGCFVEGTPIQMADGTTKEITTINVGEETKGGVVQAKMEFMPQNIYNYKDVLVSGSHWVVEDNQLVAVEDSKHGVLTDRVEPVYTFKTSNNRIWIYDIEFGDFETGSDADWEPHFEAVRQKLNKELSEKTT